MAVTNFVKVTKLQNNGVTGGTTDVVTGSVSSTAGNALVAIAGAYYDASTAHAPTLAVTGGGTWTSHTPAADHHFSGNDNVCMGFASCAVPTGGTQTITVTWTLNTASASHIGTVFIYELSNMPTSALLDLLGSAAFGSTSPSTISPFSNTNANDVLLAGAFTLGSATETHGSPTNSWVMPAGAEESNPTFLTGMTAYKVVSATGSQLTAWSISPVPGGWLNYAIALKQAGSGPVTTPISRSIAQASSLILATTRQLKRVVTASQGQSVSMATAGGHTYMLSRSVTQAQGLSLATVATRKYVLGGSIALPQVASLVARASVRIPITVTAQQGTSLSLAQVQARLPFNYYATSFPLTENPVSEGNVWLVGGRDALDWTNPRTTPGKMFGTQAGADATFIAYKDSIAVLRGTWGPDQEVTLQIFNNLSNVGAYCEAEALLRFTITPHQVTGYEITINTNPQNSYLQINRWNGLNNGGAANYTQLASVDGIGNNGDVFRATVVGSTLNVYKNGVRVIGPITDATYPSGSPGAGFFYNTNGGTADVTLWGITRLVAHTIGTPWPLGGTILQGQSLRLAQQAQIRRLLQVPLLVSLARASRVSLATAVSTLVSLVLPSRSIPLTRAITQAQSLSITQRMGVAVRVLNTSQGQAVQLVQRVRLIRQLLQAQVVRVQAVASGGSSGYAVAQLVTVTARVSLGLTFMPRPPQPEAPGAPPLGPEPDTSAPALRRQSPNGAPPLRPYTPTIMREP